MEKYTASQIKRTGAAKRFMENTCPASRHVHMMALSLARGKKYHMLDEEPEHVAVSLLSVLESLWKLRTKTGWPSPKEKAKWQRQIEKALTDTNG